MEVVIVRPPAVYGPRDRETLGFFRLAAAGILPRLAGRDLRLVMVHVEDLARGIAAAAIAPGAAGRTFHLCHREVLTLGRVLGTMADALGVRGRTVTLPRGLLHAAAFLSEQVASLAGAVPAFAADKAREIAAPDWVADPAAAREGLGWQARIAAAEGIPSTARWYRENGWLAGAGIGSGADR
jgi:nucleoside-diphosphate-sugar epimerase